MCHVNAAWGPGLHPERLDASGFPFSFLFLAMKDVTKTLVKYK